MSTCDDFQAALLDDASPPGLDDHLARCESCRTLRDAHRSALALQGASPHAPMRIPKARVARRAGALAASAAALIALAVWTDTRAPGSPTTSPEPTAIVANTYTEDEAAWLVFWLEQDLETADAADSDPTADAFGPLAQWLSPASPDDVSMEE